MLRIKLACVALAASSLSACQTAPEWSMKTGFPVKRPIVQAICEIFQKFNDIRDLDRDYATRFPKSFYVVTITMESERRNKFGAGIDASYKTRDSGDRFFQLDAGAADLAGLGGDLNSSRTSTTPITFNLTDLDKRNEGLKKECVKGYAKDTDVASRGANLGLAQWFSDVMYASPVGFPDNAKTAVRLERSAGGSLFPSWRFARGFVSPSIAASFINYDELKVELKTVSGTSNADSVKVTRDGKTTGVPAISTETYRNFMQQRIEIVPLR
jgi:hypothetical protein